MGATVQKTHIVSGTMASGTSSVVVNLPSTFIPTKSFCILKAHIAQNIQNDGMGNFGSATLSADGNSVTIQRGNDTYAYRYSLIVVCLTDGRVQKIEYNPNLASGLTHDAVVPLPIKNISKAFVIFSYRVGTIDMSRVPLFSSIVNPTTLRFTRSNAASANVWYTIYVVELE